MQRFLVNEQFGDRQYHDAYSFKDVINVCSHKDIVKYIRDKLNCAQKEMLRQTCFEHYLDLEIHDYNVTLYSVCTFLATEQGESGEELWFRLNGVDYKFNLIEFMLVIRLRFSKETNIDKYITTMGTTWFRERYFPGSKHVSYDNSG